MRLQQELHQSRLDYFTLKNVREKEMQTVAIVCSALTDRIKELNGNFSSDADDVDCDQAGAPALEPEDVAATDVL